MAEKVTDAFGEFFSTSVGAPESGEQVPLVTPGALGSLVGGYGASSHSMSTAWSSQMDRTRTIHSLLDGGTHCCKASLDGKLVSVTECSLLGGAERVGDGVSGDPGDI